MNLFAYGTLMWPEVLESVIGRRLEGKSATLTGYVRLRLKGVDYPAIIPSDEAEVSGLLYRGLSVADFDQLDRFEGAEYDRVGVCIGAVEAQAYVLSAASRHLAEDGLWHPEQLAAFRNEPRRSSR